MKMTMRVRNDVPHCPVVKPSLTAIIHGADEGARSRKMPWFIGRNCIV